MLICRDKLLLCTYSFPQYLHISVLELCTDTHGDSLDGSNGGLDDEVVVFGNDEDVGLSDNLGGKVVTLGDCKVEGVILSVDVDGEAVTDS